MGRGTVTKNITFGAFSTADILRISRILTGWFGQINYEYFFWVPMAKAVLWNCNYFLRFRFRLLKVTVPVPYLDHKKHSLKKSLENILPFLHSKLFYKEKIDEFHQIYGKMWMKKMLNEGNQISNGKTSLVDYRILSFFCSRFYKKPMFFFLLFKNQNHCRTCSLHIDIVKF
jgi:hypothetical protein